jgi:hypothetical protein
MSTAASPLVGQACSIAPACAGTTTCSNALVAGTYDNTGTCQPGAGASATTSTTTSALPDSITAGLEQWLSPVAAVQEIPAAFSLLTTPGYQLTGAGFFIPIAALLLLLFMSSGGGGGGGSSSGKGRR